MASNDFLDVNLAAQCENLAGEINKVYQHLPWALKNEAVARLKRQIHQLAEDVQKAHDSKSVSGTQKHLSKALVIVHECAPLMSLCLRKALLSPELHDRWVKGLNLIGKRLDVWSKACERAE